jgi:hypothetical protein
MIRLIIFFFLFLNFFTSFGQDSLYYITPGQTKIEVKVNEPFIIKLRSCHGCGSHWTYNLSDTIKVKLLTVRYENANGRKNWMGGDVFEFWKFIGVTPGEYNLEFVQFGPGRNPKENGRFLFELYVN